MTVVCAPGLRHPGCESVRFVVRSEPGGVPVDVVVDKGKVFVQDVTPPGVPTRLVEHADAVLEQDGRYIGEVRNIFGYGRGTAQERLENWLRSNGDL